MDTKAFEIVRKELDFLAEQGMPLCGITVRKNHEKLFEYGVNVANDQRLFLYSCSKPITIAGVMRLYERGLIGLDDPVAKYLPAYADAFVMKDGVKAKPDTVMTIRHLMTMTAGLNYDLNTDPIRKTIAEGKTDTLSIVNAFVQAPLDFSPGNKYQYSLAHDVLAAVAEVVSGKPFRQYMHEEVFAPLGMNRTSYRWQEDEIAPQYRFNAESREYEPVPRTCVYRLAADYDSGGAGIVSTLADLSLFVDAMACGGTAATGYQLLKKETIDLMRTEQLPHIAKNAEFLCPAGPDYGYGLGVRTRVRMDGGENSAYGEFGWDGAAGCFELADPANGISIAFVTHVMGWPSIRNEFHLPIRNSVYEALKA